MQLSIRLLQLSISWLLIIQQSNSLSNTRNRRRQPTTKPPPLKAALQKCYTPQDVLSLVADSDDLTADVSSLCLVRLCKQLIAIDNQCRHENEKDTWKSELTSSPSSVAWRRLSQTLGESCKSEESLVEGIKCMSVLSRILPDINHHWAPCLESLNQEAAHLSKQLQPHQLAGLKFSYDCFARLDCHYALPTPIQKRFDDLQLPYRIYPAAMSDLFATDALDTLTSQVHFQVDDITTVSNRVVRERRQTAWEGNDGVAPFAYSGKSMETHPWSPLVESVRDRLRNETDVDYDGCLLNLYPDGGSGMRYHSDPDQGALWNYETAVVSVGATRRFSFREIGDGSQQPPHTFVLMEGDVTEMFGDCQSRFQHAVRTADDKKEEAARASLVFKRTLSSE